jgi:hypothetical protein
MRGATSLRATFPNWPPPVMTVPTSFANRIMARACGLRSAS